MAALALLLLVILDASGDAFRFKGWQFIHHLTESVQVAGWIAVWALFGFELVYIPIYILSRIILFDVIFNAISKHPLMYVGESDLFGGFIRWIGRIFKVPYEHPAFIFRVMAFIAWVGLVISSL